MTTTHPGSPQLRTSRSAKLEGGTPLVQHAAGRQCALSTCTTLLSRYNPSTTCGRHEGWADSES